MANALQICFNFVLPPTGALQCNIVLVLSPQRGAAITISVLSLNNNIIAL